MSSLKQVLNKLNKRDFHNCQYCNEIKQKFQNSDYSYNGNYCGVCRAEAEFGENQETTRIRKLPQKPYNNPVSKLHGMLVDTWFYHTKVYSSTGELWWEFWHIDGLLYDFNELGNIFILHNENNLPASIYYAGGIAYKKE